MNLGEIEVSFKQMGQVWTSVGTILEAVCYGKSVGLWKGSSNKELVIDFKICNVCIFCVINLVLFLLCPGRFTKPIMHTTNPCGLQE